MKKSAWRLHGKSLQFGEYSRAETELGILFQPRQRCGSSVTSRATRWRRGRRGAAAGRRRNFVLADSVLAEFGCGRTMELGRSRRSIMRPPRRRRGAGERRPRGTGVIANPRHRKISAIGARSSSLSDDSRARGRQRDLLGPPPGRRRRFHFRSIRFGAAAIAASVSGATRSGRLGGAAAAGRRRHRGDDGARALVANAADGCGRRPRAARYGVIANRRH